MKAEIIRIGNSQGVRIPKSLLEQCGLRGAVEMSVEGHRLVIAPARAVREGWADAFKAMADRGDDAPLMPEEPASAWDDEEWRW